jgi:sirohydrochlorin ferrochelatase
MPALVLLAHGTKDAAGTVEIDRLAALLRTELPAVVVAYADVRPPTLADALATVEGPAVVVPAFLSAGYHVRVDVPAQLAAVGRCEVSLADALGPDRLLADAAAERLIAAGWRAGDEVVLAAAGSTEPQAIQDVRTAADLLGGRLGGQVRVGYATGRPRVAEVVIQARGDKGGRVAVASWLLAPGLFHRVLAAAGADVVADPLGAHARVAEVIRARYDAASYFAESCPVPPGTGAAGDNG